MKYNKLFCAVSLTLLLASCAQQTKTSAVNNNSPSSEQSSEQSQTTQTGVATANECATFAKNPAVISRVEFGSEQNFYDIVTTFEPVGGSKDEGFVLLDVNKHDFERLRISGLTRNWKISIDQVATQNLRHAHDHEGMSDTSISGFGCFRTVEETYQSAAQMARDYPRLAEWKSIGPSWLKNKGHGGYDMNVLVITNKNKGGNKPKLLLTSALHAREYSTAEFATRFAEHLVKNYGKDADITWMLDTREVHLVLQANPDGRKVAEHGVLHRKNANNSKGFCGAQFGVDLNRNFSFHWDTGGSSADPCDDTYRGSHAASEIEVQNLQNYMRRIFGDHRPNNMHTAAPNNTPGLYIDVHSYSELVLWPWGNTHNVAPNGQALEALGRKLAFFNDYKPQQAVGLYPTSGTTDDFVYGELGVAAYTFELGKKFFEDCQRFNQEIVPENIAALLYGLKVTSAPYTLGRGPDVINVSAASTTSTGGNQNQGTFVLTAKADTTRFQDIHSSNIQNALQSTIQSAEYFIDTPPWESGTAQPMNATDGRFGGRTEQLRATVTVPAGKHTVYVRAKNSNGTYGPVSAIFVEATASGNPNEPSHPNEPSKPDNTKVYETDLSTGEHKYFPRNGFDFAGGTIKGKLTGPDQADLDLFLQKHNGWFWDTIRNSMSDESQEQIHYKAPKGKYRWIIKAWNDDGHAKLTQMLE